MNWHVKALRQTSLVVVFLCLAIVSGQSQARQRVPSADICMQVDLPSLPIGVEPIWVDSHSQIHFPASDNRVVTLLASGRIAGPPLVSDPSLFAFGQVGEEFLQFHNVHQRDQYGALVGTTVRVIWLDRDLEPIGDFSLSNPETASEIRIRALWNWTIAGNYLVGFGAYSEGSHDDMGFFYHRLDRPESGLRGSSRLLLRPQGDKRGLLFKFDNPEYYQGVERYFSSIGTKAYFLEMRSGYPLQSYRIDPTQDEVQVTPMNGFPGSQRELPELPTVGSIDEYLNRRLPVLDQANLPRGIYSQGELLYALYKSPEQGWQLKQMVPGNDTFTVLGTMQIPSSAAGISLLPTEDRWFVFEHPEGDRATTMLVIPRDKVTKSFTSPLYGPGAQSIGCARR